MTPRGGAPIDVLVVGAGLIGCSVAMAVGEDAEVALTDTDPARLEVALARSRGRRWDGAQRARVAVVAVPPARTSAVVADLLRRDLADTVTHVAGVQSHVQADVESRRGLRVDRFCGGHPMAGAATSGPAGARADLFAGRAWAVCPGSGTTPDAVRAVEELALACGAEPLRMTAEQHDAAVALVSHLPQLVSSALAAVVADAEAPTDLAGPGIADTTRLAGSPAELWVDLLERNAAAVAPLVRAAAGRLDRAADALDAAAARAGAAPADSPPGDEPLLDAVRRLLDDGRRGRARIPLKRGSADPGAEVRVVLPDRPGELARALAAAAAAGVNVEDLRLEHLRGRPRGVLALAVAPASVRDLLNALSTNGFDAVESGNART